MVPGLLNLEGTRVNICLQTLRTVDRKLGFLDVTTREYADASTDFTDARARHEVALKTSRHDYETFLEVKEYAELVHLRIETFYLFARILLDDVVRAVDTLIGTNGATIGKHSNMGTNLPNLIASRGGEPPVPQKLHDLIAEVKHVVGYRDLYIAHLRLQGAVKGTVFDPEGNPAIVVQTITPRPGMSPCVKNSEPIADLRDLLERYVSAWADYLIVALPAARAAGVSPPAPI
jgi:hypothetical protein